MEPPNKTFTLSQIARLDSSNRESVRRQFDGIPALMRLVNGNQAQTYPLSSFPETVRTRLEAVRVRGGYRSIEDLLENPPAEPAQLKDLETVADPALQRARRLMAAQAWPIEHRNDPSVAIADWKARLMAGYRKHGFEFSERHGMDLLNRTIERAGVRADYGNLARYLEARPRRKKKVHESALFEVVSTRLETVIDGIGNILEPKPAELSLLWIEAGRQYETLIEEVLPRIAKRWIVNYLWQHVSKIGASREAVRKAFERRLAMGSFEDGRANIPGDPKPLPNPLDPTQLELISAYGGLRCEARVAQAQRELYQLGRITDAQIKESIENAHSKSQVLKRVMEGTKGKAEAIYLCSIKGKRAASVLNPTMELIYDGIFSMDCVVGDDATLLYFYVRDNQGGFRITRGQTLIVIDFRSGKILAWCLRPEPQYDALTVRSVLKRTFEANGLPKFIYREGGIWRRSKLVNSLGELGCHAPFSDSEVEMGFERRGVRFVSDWENLNQGLAALRVTFREAYKPNAKPVERVIGLLQDKMAGDPGFPGRNERFDCPAELKRKLELVAPSNGRPKADPAELGFYSFEQWFERLGKMITDYNAEPQEGRRLRDPITGTGLSPNDAFEIFKNRSDPPAKFDENCAFLLSHIKREVTIKAPNLRRKQFQAGFFEMFGKKFCDASLANILGQKRLAFWDPENPDSATITTLTLREPMTIPVLKPSNALYPDETSRQSMRQSNSVGSAIVTLYGTAKNRLETERLTIVSPTTRKVNEHIEEQKSSREKANRKVSARTATARRTADELGIDPVYAKPERLDGLTMMQQAKRENEEREQAQK